MDRRKFIVGLASALAAENALTKPCPPNLFSMNNPCAIDTKLGQAAQSLNRNEYLLDPIPSPNTVFGNLDIVNTTVAAFWDPVLNEVSLMGDASSVQEAKHAIYQEELDTWTLLNTNIASENAIVNGHIWCMHWDDINSTGDIFFVPQQPSQTNPDTTRNFWHYNRNTNEWRQVPNAPFNVWQNSGTPNTGLGYHPNLFGTNQAGVFCYSCDGFSAYHLKYQEWVDLSSNYSFTSLYNSTYGNRKYNGGTVFLPGRNELFFGTGRDDNGVGAQSTSNFLKLTVVKGGNPPTVELRDVPVSVNTNVNTQEGYFMIRDPRDDSTLMLLERTGDRVLTNNNGATGSWVDETAQNGLRHPFWNQNPYKYDIDGGTWTPCSIDKYGIVMGLSTYRNGGGTLIWKP